ncbi:MAG: prolyl-tRNA editing protein [Bacteroidetes bacterium GWF2_38_335]|nr:MAG: prolyl-tRNA editing protein [Bacteroidetes bacterium GWF2_38_335]OFY78147.1 MAG: prolyl-tRNA editing protein [Bacteroidetes bacterium RIFOXYA12_FULL_38_20]HBS88697.1 prolyl-tRNA editing protein [Bacteroidales bacterium]
MNGNPKLYQKLEELCIKFRYDEHPEAPTIEIAKKYWTEIDATHCKNFFFRNHKGDRHYLVVIEHTKNLDIHDLEKRLRQGKLSFASPERLMKYLELTPGSVTPFGLISDSQSHVHVFFDVNLLNSKRVSFHPCINTATLTLDFSDFMKFMENSGNTYEFLKLYDE